VGYEGLSYQSQYLGAEKSSPASELAAIQFSDFFVWPPSVYFAYLAVRLDSGMEFTIAAVRTEDLPELLSLIRELARFEKLEHEVEATVQSLNEAFFGQHPAASALVARQRDKTAGYAIYFHTFSSFVGRRGIWLEDVYVRPAFRKHGLGRALIEAVARAGAERDCGRFEWTALNWNKTALNFYNKLGAKALHEWVLLRMDGEGLRRLGCLQDRNPKSEGE
jgi:GNAT superfamily N-acetyltransferase